jgi:1-acyl-sn-glycerol-3-phosphate acyltransferase
MAGLSDLLKRLKTLEASVDAKLAKPESLDNVQRRILYSDLDLAKLDIFEAVLSTGVENSPEAEDAYSRIDARLKLLKLVPVKRPFRIWGPLEVIVRFVGVSCSIMLVGMFCSLPLLLMRAIDKLLGVDPFDYRSEYFKRNIAWFFLFQSGIETKVEGLEKAHFKANCMLMTFTHASNIDGFLVSGTCPIRQLAFGKKELFVVPFFSWISLAFGGVPVDRNNRDRAVKALKRSTDAAKNEKLCIAIAPEGTRSLTGHLLPFKKGTPVACSSSKLPRPNSLYYFCCCNDLGSVQARSTCGRRCRRPSCPS